MVPNRCYILQWNAKWGILKNVGKQMVLGPFDFRWMDKKTLWKSMEPETETTYDKKSFSYVFLVSFILL